MAASVAALAVSACVEPVKPIQPWSTETASQASIEIVTITNASSNAAPESLAALKTALDAALAQCARGATKYEMQVRVDNFKLGNAALAILVGNHHEISPK